MARHAPVRCGKWPGSVAAGPGCAHLTRILAKSNGDASRMCRLRIPNGIVKAQQFAGLADLAERYGGGYTHVTTRANIQIREVEAANAVAMIEAIQDLGLCSRGSGTDNIRNVTGTPTAGIDPQELIDTRPYTREWHFHILNDRSLYGLPRKFNVAFDGGAATPMTCCAEASISATSSPRCKAARPDTFMKRSTAPAGRPRT